MSVIYLIFENWKFMIIVYFGSKPYNYTNLIYVMVRVPGLEPGSLSAADFRTTIAFATLSVCWSGLYLHHSITALDARRLVSTRSK